MLNNLKLYYVMCLRNIEIVKFHFVLSLQLFGLLSLITILAYYISASSGNNNLSYDLISFFNASYKYIILNLAISINLFFVNVFKEFKKQVKKYNKILKIKNKK